MDERVTTIEAAAKDEASIFGEEPPRGSFFFARDLIAARKQQGRRAGAVLRDYVGICLDKRRVVNPEHYFKFRLYECENVPAKRMHDYVDPLERGKLNMAINRHSQTGGVFEQKYFFESLLRQFGLASTDTLGVVTRPGTRFRRSVASIEEVETLLRGALLPLFGKPINGSLSMGVVVVESYDETNRTLRLTGGREVSTTSFLHQIQKRYGEYGYLLQRKLEPHPSMRALCGNAIGSVRIVTLTDESRTEPLYAVWKVPSISAVADNFWRTGNVVAHVDIDTGEVLGCQVGSGTKGRAIERHPETDERLVGFVLPDWAATRQLAINAASALYSVGVIGWDIAMTEKGAVLIEGNYNPDHGMLQTAADRGLYSTEAGKALLRARERAERRADVKRRDDKKRAREILRERPRKALREGFKTHDVGGGTP